MLFSDSLLDVSAVRRPRWPSLAAYALEALAVAIAVVLPLWHIAALPPMEMSGMLVGPPSGPAPRSEAVHRQPHHGAAPAPPGSAILLLAPAEVPHGVDMTPDTIDNAEPGPPCIVCVHGAIPGGGGGNGVLERILPPPAPLPAAPPKPDTRVVVSGGVSQGYLLRHVQPAYPAIARTARIEGSVVLGAVISREGAIVNLRALSGPPMLIPAAIDAVRQWRYRPYLLNGQPVEVETQITVNFILH